MDWFCKDCNSNLCQFDCIFDDWQGRVQQYLKVCYENHFLTDFLHAQVDINLSPKGNGNLYKPGELVLGATGLSEIHKHKKFLY